MLFEPECNYNELYQNTFNDNEYGLCVEGHDNRIYLNNFKNNTNSCIAGDAWNYWDKNYWDTYDGTDSNDDAIGDTPYTIGDNNIDYHPLMIPWEDFVSQPEKPGGGWERPLRE